MNNYKNIPDCFTKGCHEAGIYWDIYRGQGFCEKHAIRAVDVKADEQNRRAQLESEDCD